jgi:hypothetical protein
MASPTNALAVRTASPIIPYAAKNVAKEAPGGIGKMLTGMFTKDNLKLILPFILTEVLNSQIRGFGKIAGMSAEGEAIRGATEATTPEAAFYQAMMPEANANEQNAEAMLMRQLMGGGGGGSRLATGEELIG